MNIQCAKMETTANTRKPHMLGNTTCFKKLACFLVVFTLVYVLKSSKLVNEIVPRIVKLQKLPQNLSEVTDGGRLIYTVPVKPVVPEKSMCQYNKSDTNKTKVDLSKQKLEVIEALLEKTVSAGGMYKPNNCTSKQRVAIVVPYRDRLEHLKIFLRHMHPFLQRKQLEYGIFVIEMDQNITFSRAVLMNIGFVEALKVANFTCFVFHDVDLIPEDERIPYHCASMPQHLSVAVDTFGYKLPYKTLFGGVTSMSYEHFEKINGFSNMFFGWGGEDDDLYNRIMASNLSVVRPSIDVARFRMIKHAKDKAKNSERFCLLRSSEKRMKEDGLSSLMYMVKAIVFRPLYTWMLVQVNETELTSNIHKDCKKSVMPVKVQVKKSK